MNIPEQMAHLRFCAEILFELEMKHVEEALAEYLDEELRQFDDGASIQCKNDRRGK